MQHDCFSSLFLQRRAGTDQTLYVYDENPSVTGCCYHNPMDPRNVVMAKRPGACGLVPTPNMATRGGRKCLIVPVVIIMASLSLSLQLVFRMGNAFDTESSKCYEDQTANYCGLKWCGTDYDCEQDSIKGFDTAEACQLWWSEHKGENDVSCEPYRGGSCYMDSPFCSSSGTLQLSNGTDLNFYECMGWYVDQCF